MCCRKRAPRRTVWSRRRCATRSRACWYVFRFTDDERTMRCPSCTSLDTQVKDSRPTEDSSAIRRRRLCLACGFRFTTFERVQLRELVVIKRNGRRVPFDRDKLLRSMQIACRKRPGEPERIDHMVSKIVRELEGLGASEVASERIGETAMAY